MLRGCACGFGGPCCQLGGWLGRPAVSGDPAASVGVRGGGAWGRPQARARVNRVSPTGRRRAPGPRPSQQASRGRAWGSACVQVSPHCAVPADPAVIALFQRQRPCRPPIVDQRPAACQPSPVTSPGHTRGCRRARAVVAGVCGRSGGAQARRCPPCSEPGRLEARLLGGRAPRCAPTMPITRPFGPGVSGPPAGGAGGRDQLPSCPGDPGVGPGGAAGVCFWDATLERGAPAGRGPPRAPGGAVCAAGTPAMPSSGPDGRSSARGPGHGRHPPASRMAVPPPQAHAKQRAPAPGVPCFASLLEREVAELEDCADR
jgi:hypothetical protein